MRRTRHLRHRAAIGGAALVLASLAGSAGAAEQDRALRNVTGVIESVRTETIEGGAWLFATVRGEGSASPVELRVGPADVVEASGFELREGDRVQVRLFVGEPPNDVQRMRNARTGRVLRVRCLNGEFAGARPGRHGGPPAGAGGHGGGPTRRPSNPPRP